VLKVDGNSHGNRKNWRYIIKMNLRGTVYEGLIRAELSHGRGHTDAWLMRRLHCRGQTPC